MSALCNTADVKASIHFRFLRWQPWFVLVSLWGYVKDSALLPPLPQDLPQLRRWDIAAIPEITRDMLQRVWAEMDIGVTAAVLQRADTYSIYEVRGGKKLSEFFFPSLGRILQSFPPLKWTDFVRCVRELWITLYDLGPYKISCLDCKVCNSRKKHIRRKYSS